MSRTITKEKKTEQSVPSAADQLGGMVDRVIKAQKKFATFSQEQVDKIFRQAALAANTARIELAKEAVQETRMGIVEDKVVKNHFAAEFIFNKYKDEKTCGILETDSAFGIAKIAEPIGILFGIIPTTNPTSTAIFKALLALKTRNGIIFSPHPRAKGCTVKAAKIILDAAVKAGAPEDIIGWISEPSLDASNYLMNHPGINMILATGGPGMVRAAYSSGKPAIGVGAGNTPALIDETADIKMAVSSILMSKTVDNGVVCASEQSVIVHDKVYEQVKKEFQDRGAHLLKPAEKKSVAALILDPEKGSINPEIVGQPAAQIAELAEVKVPAATKVLIGEVSEVGPSEPFSYEKLSPVLAMYRCKDWKEGTDKARELVELGGIGHTSVLYTAEENRERITSFGETLKTGRILVNMPTSQGAIGDIYNFRLEPSLTLGCGSWGGNSVSENVGVKHLMNIKTVAERRENMLWFQVPQKIYHKYGCLPVALKDLQGKKRVFVVTDSYLFNNGYVDRVSSVLEPMGMDVQCFHQVEPDPTLATIKSGLKQLLPFQPDVIIGLGGGSPMDAAKIMWLLYEHPELSFEGLSMRFMDIRKRIYTFPEMGRKAIMVGIPTTSGTGSEVTPFSVVTDEETGQKYPIADYSLTPDMAIIDTELVMSMPQGLTAASGIDALTHSLEAIASVMSTDYTNAIAMEAVRILLKYLPQAFAEGEENRKAREKVHNASTMAGMAFANAFLGVCHSMAHKLGAAFHVTHGVANALLINQTIRFNANDTPTKQTSFPQYEYPSAISRYARVADYLGLGGKTDMDKIEKLIAAIDDLKAKLNLPKTIKDLGINESDFLAKLDSMAEAAFDDQCTGANPRYPLIKELKQIYLNAWNGIDEPV